MKLADEQFENLINEALDELPREYVAAMKNVAIVQQDEPSSEQRDRLKLRCHETLFGLYEGIPLTQRTNNYSMVLPDKITIFKLPILRASRDNTELKEQIKRTVWHEMAHHFGLDHGRIHSLESKKLR